MIYSLVEDFSLRFPLSDPFRLLAKVRSSEFAETDQRAKAVILTQKKQKKPLKFCKMNTLSSPNRKENPSFTVLFPDHLKKIPEEDLVRNQIREKIAEIDRSSKDIFPLSKSFLEKTGSGLLAQIGLDDQYLGWTMVLLAGHFWEKEIEKIPYTKRLLLLPHCLRDSEQCAGTYTEEGLNCAGCGNCPLADLISHAREKGYKILIAEGTPIVMKIILSGEADAILGVGCLKSLERSFDKLIHAGIPAMAVPLLSGNCKDTKTEEEAVHKMIDIPWIPSAEQEVSPSLLPLLRAASGIFAPAVLQEFLPEFMIGANSDPLPFDFTDHHACDSLLNGGKYYRPFLVLAAYDSLCPVDFTKGNSDQIPFPRSVQQTALAMEFFHKASLVHDDIEDDDFYRYGKKTLHHRVGLAQALNIGDYLLGQGYHLIAGCTEIPDDVRKDILNQLSLSHLLLCRGQGSELAFSRLIREEKAFPSPAEILRIYALKTAPAFEAAILSGLRFAMKKEEYEKIRSAVSAWSRFLGIGYQIKNDLNDWFLSDPDNKKTQGSDLFRLAPTVLLAFALESLSAEEKKDLFQLVRSAEPDLRPQILDRVYRQFDDLRIFEKCGLLIQKYKEKALDICSKLDHASLRERLQRLTEMIL
ncbi:MAG: polyprenyl synthetase family protein [Planctomycetia bacterium]|nr:polyprenyl synthetase family protein [Planctomycetia bacterium]